MKWAFAHSLTPDSGCVHDVHGCQIKYAVALIESQSNEFWPKSNEFVQIFFLPLFFTPILAACILYDCPSPPKKYQFPFLFRRSFKLSMQSYHSSVAWSRSTSNFVWSSLTPCNAFLCRIFQRKMGEWKMEFKICGGHDLLFSA